MRKNPLVMNKDHFKKIVDKLVVMKIQLTQK